MGAVQRMKPSIQTFSGIEFNYTDVTPDMINIEDIAHALANQPRFAGHTRQFYSVAQHCVHVSLMIDQGNRQLAKCALLHDAAEAYMLDVPTPLKRLLPDYKAIYDRVEAAICNKFTVGFSHPELKAADWKALCTEHRDLKKHVDWWQPKGPLDPKHIVALPPVLAKDLFLLRWDQVK